MLRIRREFGYHTCVLSENRNREAKGFAAKHLSEVCTPVSFPRRGAEQQVVKPTTIALLLCLNQLSKKFCRMLPINGTEEDIIYRATIPNIGQLRIIEWHRFSHAQNKAQ